MGVKFEGKSYAGNMPVFWRGEAKILPGGYKLLQTFPKGTVIPKGTPLHIVIGTLTAAVSKYAKVVSGGTTIKPRVPKGTLFQINDIVMKEGETTGVTVSSIDTSNADYDVLTLSSAISGLAADDVLIEATATSSSAAKYEPNAVVGEDTEPLAGSDQDTVSAAYDAVVLLGYTVQLPASWMQGICMKNNPNIIYVKQ
jgi:hypothetical protein|nr:MAG TPA: Head fiber protein [Caudoviricetes sp.]